jgi:hypothetical protein
MALLHVTQFFQGDVTAGLSTSNTVYTVPSGKRIVIRYVHCHSHDGGAARTFVVRFGGLAVRSTTVAAGGDFEWFPWYVLNDGQTIDLRFSTRTGAACEVAGSLYFV